MTITCKSCELLKAEVARLRNLLDLTTKDHTHQCKNCLFSYTPQYAEPEDCPACGHDGVPKNG